MKNLVFIFGLIKCCNAANVLKPICAKEFITYDYKKLDRLHPLMPDPLSAKGASHNYGFLP